MNPEDTPKEPQTIESLIAALQDKNSSVRVNAAQSLGALRDPRAVEPLAAMLKHLDKNTQIAAAKALGEIGDPKAIEPLTTALKREYYETYDAIKDALTKLDAADIVNTVTASRAKAEATEENKEAGRSLLLWGAGLLGIGLLCTIGSAGAAQIKATNIAAVKGFGSAQYFVFSGPMIIGGILLSIGFFRSQGAISVGKILASLGVGFFGFFDLFGAFSILFHPETLSTGLQISLVLGLLVSAVVLAIRLAIRPWRDIIIAGIATIVLFCLFSPYFSQL